MYFTPNSINNTIIIIMLPIRPNFFCIIHSIKWTIKWMRIITSKQFLPANERWMETVSTKREYTLASKPITQKPEELKERQGVHLTHHWVRPNWTKPYWVLGWAKSVYVLLMQTVVLYPFSIYFPAGANWWGLSIFIDSFIYESVHWAYSNSIIQSTPSPQSDTGLFVGILLRTGLDNDSFHSFKGICCICCTLPTWSGLYL